MIINHNLMANNALRNMSINSNNSSKAMEKLSSGLRINRAGDDAAGLAISEKMRGQINGLNQASTNAQDSISLIQTAEGALNETHSILQRMRTLAVQSSNDTNTTSDRTAIQNEINQLADEIDRIGNTTEFNTKKLLNGDVVGVNDAVDGTAVINNNSSIKTINVTATMTDSVAGSATIDGAVTMTLVSLGASGTATYDIRGTDGKALASTELTTSATDTQFILSSAVTGVTGGFIASADMSQMKVGESITIVFNAHKDAISDGLKSITA